MSLYGQSCVDLASHIPYIPTFRGAALARNIPYMSTLRGAAEKINVPNSPEVPRWLDKQNMKRTLGALGS